MDKEIAFDILYDAISEAYPYWSCESYKEDYDKASSALEYLSKLVGGGSND